LLLVEIEDHKDKLKRISGYEEYELVKTISLITSKIRFINVHLIPTPVLINSQNLLEDIDVDDTEFIALTTHIRGKFWSGDKTLQKGLLKKGWNKFITTNELYQLIHKKK
jgi:predicted nucleic acid-binding protein